MNKSQRQNKLLDFLSIEHINTYQELANQFNVSINTIRRDITELSKKDLVSKLYGGVKLSGKKDTKYSERLVSNLDQKKKIANYAGKLIKNNDTIFIDSGTTTALLPDYINTDYNISFVTNNLHIINKVKDIPNWSLMVVGTKLKHSSHSFISVNDWSYYDSLNFNKSFISTTGFTMNTGATNPNNEESIIKKNMIHRSRDSYLLLDSSKFGESSLYTFADPKEFNEIITSGSVPDRYLSDLALLNTELIVAQ